MRIATYNIWNSAIGMPERKQQLIEEIIKISADIICLQEVPNKAAHQDLVERCRYQFAVFHEHANEEEGLKSHLNKSAKLFLAVTIHNIHAATIRTDIAFFIINFPFRLRCIHAYLLLSQFSKMYFIYAFTLLHIVLNNLIMM